MTSIRSAVLFVAIACGGAADAAESCTFAYRPAKAGDRTTQIVDCRLDVEVTYEQAKQTIDTERQQVRRRQKLGVTVLETGPQGTKVRVAYEEAKQVNLSDGEERTIAEPVAGKTYLVTRRGEEFVITNARGETPSAEELEIVTSSTSTVGRPNPIARFLSGRTVAVGETLSLPAEIAKEAMGLGKDSSEVSKFALTLTELREVDGVRCARFDAEIMLAATAEAEIAVQVTGSVLLEVEACRARTIEFVGPVSHVATHGPKGGEFQIITCGALRMKQEAHYAQGVLARLPWKWK